MMIEFHINIGVGNGITEQLELPDSFSDKEIEEEFQEWKNGLVDASWRRLGSDRTSSLPEPLNACTTPNGRTDGHNSFVKIIDGGKTVCAFCGNP